MLQSKTCLFSKRESRRSLVAKLVGATWKRNAAWVKALRATIQTPIGYECSCNHASQKVTLVIINEFKIRNPCFSIAANENGKLILQSLIHSARATPLILSKLVTRNDEGENPHGHTMLHEFRF